MFEVERYEEIAADEAVSVRLGTRHEAGLLGARLATLPAVA